MLREFASIRCVQSVLNLEETISLGVLAIHVHIVEEHMLQNFVSIRIQSVRSVVNLEETICLGVLALHVHIVEKSMMQELVFI
ncbi:MAG: hypothetical protein LBJ78_00790 [Puniceicoccales bacterium]|nr:hypothetical protein [Puniceicoccales bacterium]